MTSANITEAYYSSVSVIVDTISQGVIDISEDVQSCSVNRQVNGASSATITLTNYSSYKNGRYNGLLHIGDRVHVAFIKDSFSIDQLTGKIAQVPVIAFNEGSFTFTVYDVIHDLSYIYWDPYAEDSLERYSLNADKLIRYAAQEGYNDSGIGIALKDFLSADNGVCHLPKDAVKIAKFPDTSEIMQNIVNAAMQNADKTSIDKSAEELYVMLFGGHSSSSSQASSADQKDDSKYNWLLESNISGKRLAAITAKLFMWSKVDTNSTEWDKNIQFKDDGKWRSWHLHDNDYHSGLYGLSRTQMTDFAKYNGEAMLADKKTQDKAIAGVYDSLSKKSAYHAIWQYFNGWVLDYDDKGNIKYGKHSKFKVGTHEMKTVDEWKNFVNRAADEVSDNVKDSGKDKKQQETKKTKSDKNKDNKLAASFGSWVQNNAGRFPTTFRDGNSRQCWNLWEWYYQDFLKLDQSQIGRAHV